MDQGTGSVCRSLEWIRGQGQCVGHLSGSGDRVSV